MFGDDFMLALTIYRENRGGMYVGMQSIANAILNRAKRHNCSIYEVCTAPNQFTSVTGKGDPELTLYPMKNDPQWITAQQIVEKAIEGSLSDLTGGATLYYNPNSIRTDKTFTLPNGQTVPFPGTWNPAVVRYSTSIAGHLFFVEI